MLSITHTIFGFTSLLFGAFVLVQVKGTFKHRLIGYAYVISMFLLCITSFGLFDLFGTFGIFHFAALISLYMTGAGVGVAIFRKHVSNWLDKHYEFMAWSYLGLLGATLNEAFVHIPPLAQIAETNQYIPLLALVLLFLGGGLYLNRVKQNVKNKVNV